MVGDAVGGCGLRGGGGDGEDVSEWSVWVGLVGECVVERGDSWGVDAVVVGEEDVHGVRVGEYRLGGVRYSSRPSPLRRGARWAV